MQNRDLFEQMGQEIVAALAGRFRHRGLMLSDFPRLTGQGFERRMNAVLSGRGKGRVDLPSVLKAFVRRRYPEYTFSGKWGDQYCFAKRFSCELDIALIFKRVHHFGLGKAFTVHLECKYAIDGEQLRWRHALLPFFERDALEWTYGQRDELESCLEEADILLGIALPDYEAAWQSLCANGQSKILEEMTQHGPLSFREAADIAYEALSALPQFSRVDAAWLRHDRPYSYFSGRPRVDAGSAAGRLTQGYSWGVRFADVETNRTVTANVPYAGRIGFLLSNRMSLNRNNAHQILNAASLPGEPLMLSVFAGAPALPAAANWREFVDSPDIMEIASGCGGAEFCDKHGDCAITIQLNAETSSPSIDAEVWYVHYFVLLDSGNASLDFNISARDRRVLYHSGI